MSTPLDSPFAKALIAGAVAGTTVDISLYPIDTLKTRLQSAQGFQASGGFRGIYAGLGSAALGAAPGAAFFFSTYESTKAYLRRNRAAAERKTGRVHKWREPFEHMVAASAGEIAACTVRVPTEVVKQRAQATQYKSSLAALQAILSQRKDIGIGRVWKNLYQGWSITVMREVPFTVIQFPLWEGMKEWKKKKTGEERVSALDSAVFGSISGGIAAAITTPLDVLKTRMMLSTEKQQLFKLLQRILRDSGPRAFVAGIGPRILWISAGGAIFLGTFQWAYNTLGVV